MSIRGWTALIALLTIACTTSAWGQDNAVPVRVAVANPATFSEGEGSDIWFLLDGEPASAGQAVEIVYLPLDENDPNGPTLADYLRGAPTRAYVRDNELIGSFSIVANTDSGARTGKIRLQVQANDPNAFGREQLALASANYAKQLLLQKEPLAQQVVDQISPP